MGKFNIAQRFAAQDPMLAVRRKLIEKKKMDQKVKETLEKQQQAAAVTLAQKTVAAKNAKNASRGKKRLTPCQKQNYDLLSTLKGVNGQDQQTLHLLNQLEQQLEKQQSAGEENVNHLADKKESMRQLELLKKQQKLAQEEELLRQEQDQEQIQLQGLMALQQGLNHVDSDGDADDEMEDDEEEVQRKEEQKKKLQDQLHKMIRENKNNAKLQQDKKEYLERQTKDQSKRLEKNVEKMMREQKLLLQHIASLTSQKQNENLEEKADSEDEMPELPVKTRKAATTRAKKQSATAAAHNDPSSSSEAQLIKYLQSLG